MSLYLLPIKNTHCLYDNTLSWPVSSGRYIPVLLTAVALSVSISAVRIFEKSNQIVTSVFDSKRVQLFKIFEYLPSPISYLKSLESFFFNRMLPIFYLSNQQNQLWPTKYWNSYNRNDNSAVP